VSDSNICIYRFSKCKLLYNKNSYFDILKTNSVILKTAMTNNYPQIAVLGCDSNKANLYYDIQRQVWVEHLVSSCINDEESILKFCQQVKFNE
jgi:hypothetical protein